MTKKNILITGGDGMLASHLKEVFTLEGDENIYCLNRSACDITDIDSIERAVKQYQIDILINTAAYTAVDLAETETACADKVNHLALNYIAKVASKYDVEVIHISTDYVFNGKNDTPYREEDPTSPVSIYGKTKCDGEVALLKNHTKSIIIRTSWLYDESHANFFTTMIRMGRERDEISVVNDQFGTPTYARDLAQAIHSISTKTNITEGQRYGVFHFSNEGETTWYDFAHEIFQNIGLTCTIHPVSTEQFVRPAQRPNFAVLDKTKIKFTFGITIPEWRRSLLNCIERFNLNIRN
ncbi:dTDP-4-dehydrorhamnose reductase [Halosquirtibacter xylanolyticus]|uniref:dTDP-4-dehydrorhamnose reductase n=1 Tax=Halosquirtibacter xylanolyticus TaxID=3374599 RepID=UPI003748A24C|nr:dTDP-4-dehydrorhamnose reductase [Prolixibacteraceae bacterium]